MDNDDQCEAQPHDLNLDKIDLPKCAEDPPPMPEGVTFTRQSWLNAYLTLIGDAFFCVFCIIVIVGFFMFVGFGLQYFLSQFVPHLLP